jgi:hypothetical protein
MTYTSEQRRAYYLSKREQHLQYSREYVNSHKDKYLAYYKAYSKMKREFYKVFVYTEPDAVEAVANTELPKAPSRTKKFKIKELKEPKVKGFCSACECKFKGSYNQHIATTKHIICEQSVRSKELREAQNSQ